MNDLEAYFESNTGGLIHKWMHYFEIYERHLARYRGQDLVFMEFGVSQGGSLQMWKHYFGARARIIGVDVNPACKGLEEPQIEIRIGDQEDRGFLRALAREFPRVDVVLDDGGHTMPQQIHTFEELFPHVHENGVFLCEDVHTSYLRRFGGGLERRGTFIEFSKRLIDQLHAWHHSGDTVPAFTRTAHGLHFYDGVVVIEKRKREKTFHRSTGNKRIEPLPQPDRTWWQRLLRR